MVFHASGLAALGAWLTAKQLLWSPAFQGGAPLRSGAIAASAAVALLVLGLAVRLRGRAQLLALFALDGALTALYQIHLLYHRQYSELGSVAALAFASQAAQVGGAILALFRPGDALLWADVAALAVAALAHASALPSARSPHANALTLSGVLLFVAPALPLLDRPLTGPRRLSVARAEVAASLNVVGYQLFDAVTFVQRRLDRSSRASLREALAYHARRAAPSGPLSGTQRGKNVIVVQLESVQASAVGRRVKGAPVTPNLDRLARESMTFTRAFAQVAQGTTSDAELLAGCSLYPLQTGAVFTDRRDIDFRCLPEVLVEAGYHTVAMHANWPNFWNRDRMYPAMGYQTFLSIRDFDRTPVIGLGLSDARFVEQAAERLAALPEPFYAVLITLSNHGPFVDPNLPRILPHGAVGETMADDYLNSVRFTDGALGVLVERLEANGILDRSVLVVYGDHQGISRHSSGTDLLELPAHRADVWLEHEAKVPLLVRLPFGRHAGPRREPAGQVDVAPTIADLLGLPPQRLFFHGRSLVSGPARPVVLPDGSAVSEELVFMSEESRWGAPGCLDAETGAPVARERCDALADHAARELAISRAEVNQDLFRWMLAGPSPPVPPPEAARQSRQPSPDLMVDRRVTEQSVVPDAARDPPPRLGDIERVLGVGMTAEGAVDGHEPVADEPRPERARQRRGSGDRMTSHAPRQRHRAWPVGPEGEAIAAMPVLVQEAAVAQVRDSAASYLAETGERGAVRAQAERRVDPAPAALEWRAVVRRPEEHDRCELAQPAMAEPRARFAGAARDEPAHAVSEDRQLLDPARPAADELLHDAREAAAVRGDVQAGVVAQVDGRVAEIARQSSTVVVPRTRPLPLGRAQAVHQHQHLRAGARQDRAQRRPGER
jgi:phosphoglycerol transferase MdoB-like AlkP superfamily enzyme